MNLDKPKKPKLRLNTKGNPKGFGNYKSKFRKGKKHSSGTGGPGRAHAKLGESISLYWCWKNNCPASMRKALWDKFKEHGDIPMEDCILWLVGGELPDHDAIIYCRWLASVSAGDRVPESLVNSRKPEVLKRFKRWLLKRV